MRKGKISTNDFLCVNPKKKKKMLLWAGNVFEKPALTGKYRNKDKT